MKILKEIFIMLLRSFIFANILIIAICFESMIIRMGIVIILYLFSFFYFIGIGGVIMKNKKKSEVQWYFPDKKRPFAKSTVATSDLITVLSEEYLTTVDVYNAINYDNDAKEILKKFIENGYGNFLLKDFVYPNPSFIYRKLENGKIISISINELRKHLDSISLDNTNKVTIKQIKENYDYEY